MTNDQSSSRTAIAMQYNPESDYAPRVTAVGKGRLADEIINLAISRNIPIHHDPHLADMLSSVDYGDYIPPSLYTVVAEVLAYVYRIQQKNMGA